VPPRAPTISKRGTFRRSPIRFFTRVPVAPRQRRLGISRFVAPAQVQRSRQPRTKSVGLENSAFCGISCVCKRTTAFYRLNKEDKSLPNRRFMDFRKRSPVCPKSLLRQRQCQYRNTRTPTNSCFPRRVGLRVSSSGGLSLLSGRLFSPINCRHAAYFSAEHPHIVKPVVRILQSS
jgi:hypothetical protein